MKISGYFIGLMVLSLISISSILIYDLAGSIDDPVDVNSIRVLNYNIHLYYDEGTRGHDNLVQVRDILRDSGADIIALQESDGNRMTSMNQHGVKWLANSLKMQYVYGSDTKDDVWGVSILSKWEILSHEVVFLPSEDALQRIAVIATIDVPGIGNTNILATHLTFQSESDQLAQINKILELTTTGEYILCGDFNTIIAQEKGLDLTDDEGFNLLNSTYKDGWVLAGGDPSAFTSYYFKDLVDNARIDYIWLTDGWNAISNTAVIYGDETVSDHRGISIDVELA
ncbi:MAG: endonuclease/exonuclease/phosphatase family protein [Candidatus Heimdallarchaeota archaeon]|nr:endonuclease/exonuclease/phosphatase family protein [Candidatus Heimdallarchaeota archaeon]